MSDRTVHGSTQVGVEVVRYDRSGKWYIEHAGRRRLVTVKAAAEAALDGTAHLGRPGGMRFDAEIRRLFQIRRIEP